MATTVNDYLVDVVYRSVYNTKKFSKSLQTGVSGLEDVENLLKVITMYQGFLEFVVDNDREFTSEEILSVVSHVDDILWSKGSAVQWPIQVAEETAFSRFYGTSSSSTPTIDNSLIASFSTESAGKYDDVTFAVTGTKYCVLAVPSDGLDYSKRLWTNGADPFHYFKKYKTGFLYNFGNGIKVYLDIYVSANSYTSDETVRLVS